MVLNGGVQVQSGASRNLEWRAWQFRRRTRQFTAAGAGNTWPASAWGGIDISGVATMALSIDARGGPQRN
jgi:hypothetical protein